MADKKSTAKSENSETKLIRELADILNETDLSEIEMEKGDLKIRVSRQSAQVVNAVAAPMVAPAPAAVAIPSPVAAVAAAAEVLADVSDHPGAVKSPMVGTAYIRPSPDASPFVSEGDMISEGDTVLLIEAMKTFNPITAPKSGKITKIMVSDAQPVEFGEALFIIE